MKLWWLSFADSALPKGAQFLGACIVPAANLIDAISTAHVNKINPGGGVMGHEIPNLLASQLKSHRVGVLMDRAECEAFELELVGARESRSAP